MTQTNEPCSVEMLHRLLRLNPETGEIFWRKRTPDMFPRAKNPEHQCNAWNARYAGTAALNSPFDGYRIGTIFNKKVLQHRAVFALTHGRWPEQHIDHLDGDPSNNRPSNLREVPHVINHRNRRLNKNNTSGHNGIGWHKKTGQWLAQITIDGRNVYLGMFIDLEDAIAARKAAEVGHGFTERHGKEVSI